MMMGDTMLLNNAQNYTAMRLLCAAKKRDLQNVFPSPSPSRSHLPPLPSPLFQSGATTAAATAVVRRRRRLQKGKLPQSAQNDV
jgi:hypothetical protein